jgi:hypothetical protein
MKKVILILLALALQACAGSAGYRVDPYGGAYSSGYGLQGYSTGASVTTAPCQPIEAGPLMEWAKGLESGKYHSRSADVTVRNDRMDCTLRESAGSKIVPPSNNQQGRR